MAKEKWANVLTGEIREFTEGETFVMLRTTKGVSWAIGLSSTDIIVWLTAADMMSKAGYFSISKGVRKRLSKELGLTERTIQDALRRLTESNVIAKLEDGEYLMNPETVFRFPARYMGEKIGEYYTIRKTGKKIEDE